MSLWLRSFLPLSNLYTDQLPFYFRATDLGKPAVSYRIVGVKLDWCNLSCDLELDLDITKSKMTSTPFNVGLNDTDRVSSRVLRPPGGGHTDIFGGDLQPEPIRGRRQFPGSGAAQGSEPLKPVNEPAKPTNGTEQNGQASAVTPENPTPKADIAQPEPQAKADNAVKTEAPVAEAPKPQAPNRVRVPPGGFSSGLW